MLLLLDLEFRHSAVRFFFGTGLLKCAKVNDYNLETVEVTNVVTEAKENSFLLLPLNCLSVHASSSSLCL